MKSALGNVDAKFQAVRQISLDFRQSKIKYDYRHAASISDLSNSGVEYYERFRKVFGERATGFFLELVALLPDRAKRRELLQAHRLVEAREREFPSIGAAPAAAPSVPEGAWAARVAPASAAAFPPLAPTAAPAAVEPAPTGPTYASSLGGVRRFAGNTFVESESDVVVAETAWASCDRRRTERTCTNRRAECRGFPVAARVRCTRSRPCLAPSAGRRAACKCGSD